MDVVGILSESKNYRKIFSCKEFLEVNYNFFRSKSKNKSDDVKKYSNYDEIEAMIDKAPTLEFSITF